MPESALNIEIMRDLHFLLFDKVSKSVKKESSPILTFCMSSRLALLNLIGIFREKLVLRFKEMEMSLDYIQEENEDGSKVSVNLSGECLARLCRKWVEKVVMKCTGLWERNDALPMLLQCENITILDLIYAREVKPAMIKRLSKVFHKLQVLEVDTATLQKINAARFRNVKELLIRDRSLYNLRRITFIKSMFPKLKEFNFEITHMTISGIRVLYEACKILPAKAVFVELDKNSRYLDYMYVRYQRAFFNLFIRDDIFDHELFVMVKRRGRDRFRDDDIYESAGFHRGFSNSSWILQVGDDDELPLTFMVVD